MPFSKFAAPGDGDFKRAILPIRLIPLPGESLRGFIYRLSEANSYPSPSWLYVLEPCVRRPFDTLNAVEALARLAGLPSNQKAPLMQPFGQNKLSNQFLSATPRFCPECLREAGYLRAVWEVSFACACPYHETYLVDKCPKCSAAISWARTSMLHCDCGENLANISSAKAGQEIVFLNGLIWRAATSEASLITHDEIHQELLDSFSLENLCSLFRFFAACNKGEKSLLIAKPRTVDEASGSLRAVNGYLKNWPREFHRFLDEKSQNKEGLSKSFGSLYRHLYFSGNTGLDFVQTAFQDYVNSRWTGLLKAKQLQLPLGGLSISTNDAAKVLGVGRRFLANLIEKELIEAKKIARPSGRNLTVISNTDAQRLRDEMLFWINGKEALKLLGIRKSHLKIFIEAGLIRPIVRPEVGGFGQWIFDSREIMSWLEEFQQLCHDKMPPKMSVSFSVVCKNLLPSLEHIPELLNSVLSGDLPIAGISTNSEFRLSALYFDPGEIEKFRADRKEQKFDGQYTIPDLAIRLGVKQEVAYHLVNRGIIPCLSAEKEKFSGRIVTEKEAKKFEAKYAKLSDIAKAQGCSGRGAHLPVLQKKLSKSGIFPVIGPDVDGCRQCFYLRLELNKVDAVLNRGPSYQRIRANREIQLLVINASDSVS